MYIVRHLARRLRTLRGMTIVHVGAHYGEEAEEYQRWGAARVIWVEAAPDMLDRLQAHLDEVSAVPPGWFARLTRAPRTEHKVIHALVADRDGVPMQMHVFTANDSNSLFPRAEMTEAHPWLQETGEVIEMRSRRLDDILDEAGIPPEEVDVLAMDIQGAELLCLKGAPRLVAHVPLIETEVMTEAFYEGGVLLPELDAWLAKNGFRRKTWVRRRSMNAVYARA